MPRSVRTHLAGEGAGLVPQHLTKQQFGQRLARLMLAKRWNQSELARQAGLPRDSISTYVRGRSLPTPVSLHKMAAALGVRPEELLPNQTEAAVDADTPSVELRVSTSQPNAAWLRVNRLVSLETAVEVARLLEKDRPFEAFSGSEK